MTDSEHSDGNNSGLAKSELLRLSELDRVTHFPLKLWDVVEDEACDIFRWSEDGHSFYVDDVRYESEIMERYPGFVQISSFANLRRLLREYSFTWKNNEAGEFEFSHPCFLKARKDMLPGIKTKRKSLQSNTGNPSRFRRRPSGSDGRSSKHSSCNWMQPVATGAVRLRMDTLMRFPEKLWAVVNDPNDLLYWGEEGKSVIVDDKKFEEEVMQRYPGFVQIAAFANLRRLLREYGFSWSIRDNGFFEFSHPCLTKGRPDLVSGVKTKRKAVKSGAHHPYLPYYRMDPPVHNHQNGYGDVPYDTYGHHIPLPTSTSPEVNQAVGSIQSASSSEILFGSDQAIRNIPPDCQHATGDHLHMQHQHLYGHAAAALNYRYMPCHMPPSVNYWSVQQGSGDKVDAPVYYYSDHLNYNPMHGEAAQQFQQNHPAAQEGCLPSDLAEGSDCQASPLSSRSTMPSTSNHCHEGNNGLMPDADCGNSTDNSTNERKSPLTCTTLRERHATMQVHGLSHQHAVTQQPPPLLITGGAAATPGLSNSYSNLYMMHHPTPALPSCMPPQQMFYPLYPAMQQVYHQSYASAGATTMMLRPEALKQEPVEDGAPVVTPPVEPSEACHNEAVLFGASSETCCQAAEGDDTEGADEDCDQGRDNSNSGDVEAPLATTGEDSIADYGSSNDEESLSSSKGYSVCDESEPSAARQALLFAKQLRGAVSTELTGFPGIREHGSSSGQWSHINAADSLAAEREEDCSASSRNVLPHVLADARAVVLDKGMKVVNTT